MFKSFLYVWLSITTALRFADLLYLLIGDNTYLPMPVLIATSIGVIYGMFLIVKRFWRNIRLKELMYFFIVQGLLIAFNLFYVSAFYPLWVKWEEILVVGTFLDLLLDIGIIYFCIRKMRSQYALTVQQIYLDDRHV